MQASDIMTTKLVTATPEAQIDEIANLMMEHNISGVPILAVYRSWTTGEPSSGSSAKETSCAVSKARPTARAAGLRGSS